jgi:hypothetical protein
LRIRMRTQLGTGACHGNDRFHVVWVEQTPSVPRVK